MVEGAMKLLLNVTGDEPCADCGWDEWETRQTNANVIILGGGTELVLCSDCLQQLYQMKAPGYTAPDSKIQMLAYSRLPYLDTIMWDQFTNGFTVDRRTFPVKKKK